MTPHEEANRAIDHAIRATMTRRGSSIRTAIIALLDDPLLHNKAKSDVLALIRDEIDEQRETLTGREL